MRTFSTDIKPNRDKSKRTDLSIVLSYLCRLPAQNENDYELAKIVENIVDCLAKLDDKMIGTLEELREVLDTTTSTEEILQRMEAILKSKNDITGE